MNALSAFECVAMQEDNANLKAENRKLRAELAEATIDRDCLSKHDAEIDALQAANKDLQNWFDDLKVELSD